MREVRFPRWNWVIEQSSIGSKTGKAYCGG